MGPFSLFGPFFGVRVKLKIIFGTYLCRQSTLVLGRTVLSFCFLLSKLFGLILHFFLPFGQFFGAGVRFKKIFGTYTCRQSTLFLKVYPYLCVFNLNLILPNLWHLLTFSAFWSYSWGWGQVQSFFGTYLYRQSTLVLEVHPYLFVFNV